MKRKKLNRRPTWAFRTGSVLLSLVWLTGTAQAGTTLPSSSATAAATSVDPDAPLRPKLSPAERARMELTLQERAEQVVAELNAGRTRLGLGADDELRLLQAQIDPYGMAHFRLRQYHRGLRVLGVGMVTHRDATTATESLYLARALSLDTEPAIDAAQATSLAQQAFGAPPGTPLVTQLELAIEPMVRVRFEPDASGGVTNSDQMYRDVIGYRLVYLAQVAPEEPEEPEEMPDPAPTVEAPAPSPSRAGAQYPLDDLEPESAASRTVERVELTDAPLQVLIDAKTGRILSQHRDVNHAGQAVTSLGHSQYHGDVELSTRYDTSTNRYQLQDPHRGGNQVRDLKNGTWSRLNKSYLYWGTDNEWGDGQEFEDGDSTSSARGETVAVDVAYGLERTWDLLHKVFGRKGLDGKNSPIRARVHYGHQYRDAHWSNLYKAPYFGDGTNGSDPMVGNTSPNARLDVVGHELGHGLWFYELGRSNGAIAGGINEGHGDILGSLAEFYTFGHDGLGYHVPDTRAAWNWRSRMVNPEGYTERNEDGEVRRGLRYFSPTLAEEPVHVVGTLYGHAFVFLAHGAVSDPSSSRYSYHLPNGMAGIGANRAAELWYLATTAYLPEDPYYSELRSAYLAAAKQLYGEGSRVHNAVKDAFGAVGVGQVASDTRAPEIVETHLASVDEGEGTVFAVASVSDDTGVLRTEFKTGPNQTHSGFSPFEAYLDISTLSLGSHPVSVTAVDRTLKSTQKTLPLILVGSNQLLVNGGFESGTTGWTATSGVIGKLAGGRPQPFMGAWNAVFSANDALSQTVTIPADATSVPWSFRVRVENDATESATLSVLVKDLGTGVQTSLAVYDRQDVKYFTAGRHYRRGQFDLASFRGRQVQLRFVSSGTTGSGDFSVDNVSLTYSAPIKVGAPKLTLHEDEETLRFDFTGISGYAPSRIKKVEYVVGGVVKAAALFGPSFSQLVSIKGWPTGNTSVVARVYDHVGNLVGQSPAVALTLKGAKQALLNGDFEAGTASWTLSGSVSVGTDSEGVYLAFLGQRYGRLGGKGVQHDSSLSQLVGLPDDILSARLSYRLDIDTQEDNLGTTDKLQVEAQILPNGAWQVLDSIEANANISGGETFGGYQRREVSLTTFKGKTVRLRFRVQENAGLATTYRIDNVSVTYVPLAVSN
ncbi:M4 family metallopeptidase [Archangium violaceum]|uniref:M4 family metallopeptidase n=1 Tax=Archangium violaceum TaxID=83451 RepID=UPI002B314185|nr:M4 family metallopeptidase [Archangium violaceum]